MSSLRSAFYSVSGTLLSLSIALFGMVVLARLVAIEDHGIYAIAYSIFLIFQPFIDFGLTPVYIKLEKILPRTNSVFFFFNIVIGIGIAIFLMALSPVAVIVFENDSLIGVMLILSVSVVLMCAGNQPTSQLFREKRFFIAECVRNISDFMAVILAILLALLDFGLWALAAKFFFFSFFRFLSAWIAVRPQYQWVTFSDLKAYGSSIKFGGFITASRFIAGYANNLDKLVIGKVFGESAVGHYEKALVIVSKPNTLRNALSTPAVSHLARSPKSRYNQSYYLLVYLLSFFAGIPALFF